jgi:hypothetical protein
MYVGCYPILTKIPMAEVNDFRFVHHFASLVSDLESLDDWVLLNDSLDFD